MLVCDAISSSDGMITDYSLCVQSGGVLLVHGRSARTFLALTGGTQQPTRGTLTRPEHVFYMHAHHVRLWRKIEDTLHAWVSDSVQEHALPAAIAYLAIEDVLQRYGAMLRPHQRWQVGLAQLMLTRYDMWVIDGAIAGLHAENRHLLTGLLAAFSRRGGIALVHADAPLPWPDAAGQPPQIVYME